MNQSFKITPRVIAHLGEDLIKNESIALVELVKNSYDAGASFCDVEFSFSGDTLMKIVVSDNGSGMDIQTVQKSWLVIGTDNKKKQLEQCTIGRMPLGEKGIGRLGVHKLGNKIHLESKKDNCKPVEVDINWTLLDKAEKVSDFPVTVKENDCSCLEYDHGTRITITELKGEWNRRKLRSVFRDLQSLNSPFVNRTDSFNVNVSSNSDVFQNLPCVEDILNAAMYIGHCVIDGDQVCDFSYRFKPWDSLSNISGRQVDWLDDNDSYLKRRKETKVPNKVDLETFSLSDYKIGKITLDFYIFEKDTSVFSFMNMERTTLNNYLRENAGVRVYRDGVRVYNYGEKDSDWLSLDFNRLKRSGGNISNNIIIGAVGLSRRDSVDLKEKTNREGFIEDEAYLTFVDAVTYALDLFVRLRNEDKMRLVSIYKKDVKAMEPVLSDLNSAIEIIQKKVDDIHTRNELIYYLNRVNNQYVEVRDVLIRSANAGLNLGGAIHEIDKQVSALMSCVNNGQYDIVKDIALHLENIVNGYTVFLKKSVIKKTDLSTIIGIVIDNTRFRFKDHNIKVFSNRKSVSSYALLSQTESVAALTNLIDNSIYWVSLSRSEDRKMGIYITDEIEGYSSIIVCDNGSGFKLSPEIAIQPFVTGKPLNTGMGLGLHITHEVMKAMNGKLLILDKDEINLPDSAKKHGINKALVALCFPKA